MGCGSAGWSAVSSAGANSALAGVLAGFMLNGIVVLLSRTITDIGKVRALGLLLAAFVALGLDSYLFGLVTGDKSCHRAWTEAMLAAGLLAIGTVAIIAGFGLLVAEYVEKKDSESVEMLTMLFDVLRLGVALVVLSLLLMTSWNYLYAVLGDHVPRYAKDLLWTYLGIGVAGLAILATISLIARVKQQSWTRLLNSLPIFIRFGDSLAFKQKVKRAIYSSFGYAVVSVLGATFFARTSQRHWDHPDTLVTAAIICTVGWVLVASLVPLFYLLVRCSPPFGEGAAKRHGPVPPGALVHRRR